MSLEKVLSISGKPGLYKLITQTRGGFVAESLIDKKRLSVGLQNNVSVLSEIAIYTLTEEVPLKEVFKKIKDKEEGGQTSVKPKDGKDKGFPRHFHFATWQKNWLGLRKSNHVTYPTSHWGITIIPFLDDGKILTGKPYISW